MTQYPNPYPSPGFDYYRAAPPRDPLAPARRASVLLFVLGGLAVLGGVCVGAGVWLVPLDQVVNQLHESLSQQQLSQLPPGMTLEQLARIVYTGLGVLGVGFGVFLLCLAPFVRKGGRGSTITAIVLFVLVGLWCLLNLLGVLVQLASGPSAATIGGLVIVGLMGGAVIFALILLVHALRGSGYAAWHRQQAQAQYWYHQQQQAAHSQGGAPPAGYGYGYGYVPPPPPEQPPAATPPTTTEPPREPRGDQQG